MSREIELKPELPPEGPRVTKSGRVPVTGEMSVAEGFQAIVMACLRHLRLNEPLLVDERDPEALHQVRVAIRRLRAALSLFRSAIADEDFARIRDGLRWLAGELGRARNLDVCLQHELSEDQRAFLLQRRAAAYDVAVATIASHRFRRLLLDLVGWVSFGDWRQGQKAGKPLRPYVDRRIDRVWRKIERADALHSMDECQRHRLRIDVKKLRYALDFVAPLHNHRRNRRKKFGRSVEQLQDALGDLNDAALVRAVAEASPWPMLPDGSGELERTRLETSERALRRLRKIGRYWAGAEE